MTRLFPILVLAYLTCFSPLAFAQDAKVEDVQTALGTREQIIVHEGYTVSYNSDRLIPNWVAYELTKEEATSKKNFQVEGLRRDPKVKGDQASPYDYENSHDYVACCLAPLGDMLWSQKAAEESLFLSNVCPQAYPLNDGAWLELEQMCRKWAAQYGTLYVVSGTMFFDGVAGELTVGPNKVSVPHAMFKVVCQKRGSKWYSAGFLFTNTPYSRESISGAWQSVDIIEYLSGHDFFWRLPANIQDSMEASSNPADWSVSTKK